MITKYFKYFFTAASEILDEYALPATQITNKDPGKDKYDIFATIGLTGDFKGLLTIQFNKDSASELVKFILNQNKLTINQEDFKSFRNATIGELANQITGRSVQYLSDNRLNCFITPPTIFAGKNISADFSAVNITQHKVFTFSGGSFCLSVGYSKKK